jgi:hypothetical protein
VYNKVTDEEFQKKVKETTVQAYEGAKSVRSTITQLGAKAIDKVRDPAFQESVKETTAKAYGVTKEKCAQVISAFLGVREGERPEFQKSVKENIVHGYTTAKHFVVNTEVDKGQVFSTPSEGTEVRRLQRT